MWLTNSRPISQDKAVQSALSESPRYIASQWALKKHKAPNTVLVGWGNKPSTQRSRAWANALSIPYHQLEDGFISYLGHPALGDNRLSIIHDTQGIYYDARQPSDLESLLNTLTLTDSEKKRSRSLIDTLCHYGISKYNHTDDIIDQTSIDLPDNAVVLVDQTAGDASINGALATSDDFISMIKVAITEHPDQNLYLKVHPDVLLGKKQGVLYPHVTDFPQVKLLPPGISLQHLFHKVQSLYTVSSQLGFEGLWYGCKVHCFGMPFYAGRGLTIDHKKPITPRGATDLETLTFGALIRYCHYIHPETESTCDIEDLLPFFIQRKKIQNQYHYSTIYAVGFSLWKRLFLRSWLNPMTDSVKFCSIKYAKQAASDNDAIAVWGNHHLSLNHPHLLRLEDGFIRSQGLGIDLTPPLSLIFDTQGIYFDATKPSDVEILLQTSAVSNAECRRAEALIEQITAHKISKYNLAKTPLNPDLKGNKTCILVPGQVESDASIKYGVNSATTIAMILEQTRKEQPDAFIIYRPHPDVLTGERQGLSIDKAKEWADYIDIGSDIHSAIELADEVRVLTSLVGFEALLRQKTVVCYGQPFYAGWGLTRDINPNPRRTKKRTLHELCFIVLIAYPRYLHPKTGRDSTPESIIRYLSVKGGESKAEFGFVKRFLKKINTFLSLLLTQKFHS